MRLLKINTSQTEMLITLAFGNLLLRNAARYRFTDRKLEHFDPFFKRLKN